MSLRSVPARGLWAAAAMLVVAGLSSPVRAVEPYDLNIQNFRPAMDSKGFVTVERSKALGTFEPSFGLYLNYMWNPAQQRIDGKDHELVTSFGQANFLFAIGFFNVVELGANLPVVIVRGDGDGPGDEGALDGDGLGDTQLSLKVRILDRERFPVGLAVVPVVHFGTGQSDLFVSNAQTPVFAPRLVVDWDIGSRVGMAANLGARLRERREINTAVVITGDDGIPRTVQREDPFIVGNELLYSLGIGITLLPERLELIFEGYGAAPIEDGAERATPLEVLAALRIFLVGNSFMTVGATRGLMGAYGDPDVRAFAGIIFEPAIGDRDGDGIPDDIDKCPNEPEDMDGWQDHDGCPDPDNDGDGILDIVDQCPNDPEDFNGFEDDDGCPDGMRDRDGDGIPDHLDKCPDEPEDFDGFQDADGCPDPDNDGDGIPDVDDQCPNDPEDYDGWQDEDGCPDPDNDGDGIPDNIDKCPNTPENFNGIEDDDGCPELPKKVIITGGKLMILDKVYFETNKAIIKPESYDILNQVAETLTLNPQILKVEVQGHTDSRGGFDYNMDLSDRRAAAVRTYLIERGQVAPRRLVSKGYGYTQPIDEAENVAAWAKNRRVEFVILEEGAPPRPDSPVIP